jgi:hypothetical protein
MSDAQPLDSAIKEINDLKTALDEHAIVAITDTRKDHIRQQKVLHHIQIFT